MDLGIHLSPHYQLFEFVNSYIAERKGIDNTPSEKVIINLRKLCETILEPARRDLGPIRILSGYRCELLNKEVGGSSTSGHLYGFCADLDPLKVSRLDLAKWIVKNVAFDQVILEFGTTEKPAWVHASSDPRHRHQVLRILSDTDYVPIKL